MTAAQPVPVLSSLNTVSLQTEAGQMTRGASGDGRDAVKAAHAAKDFESILLGNWLQQAEDSFGKLPGDDDADQDAGGDQLQGIAMQSLGEAMAKGGGIGLAKMIVAGLKPEAPGTTEDAQ